MFLVGFFSENSWLASHLGKGECKARSAFCGWEPAVGRLGFLGLGVGTGLFLFW